MVTLKLKIEDRGLVIELPGVPSTRTPAIVDITNIDINLVFSCLKKGGFTKYKILSTVDDGFEKEVKIPELINKKKEKVEDTIDTDRRFNRLESMMMQLLSKNFESKTHLSQEQITNKLDRLEKITQSIANGQKQTVEYKDKSDEPVIEEMDTMFIPDIDLDGMSLKGSSLKTIEVNEGDLDEAADLLSSITRKEK